ncbi:HAD family hydrolase [Aspergillus clavatus NRRL 1]|uniref:Haloacid dehalogenase-like hydrolase, putative n=1 Tax=Aspergillus clavatus (strain ATCC 1007 / CBS 513.65 / DSM 816 / NCTC 3887 / NRRL 1 / QM 1276 / 107) TaxID=344612 RepID=A1CUT1_ASPCL|nr:haloacid dehalogenase-like hydrolase, putative [Aspergillus clavatus NRRL 1]EAW07068.1 haloacid dehalogenase-like hydrolase, putative [Aspergillus clavatus NRRL 1]
MSSNEHPTLKTPKPKLVIFDFDGTIMDTTEAINTTFYRSFELLLPDFPVPEEALRYRISLGQPAAATFGALWPDTHKSSFDVEKCVATFRAMYDKYGFDLQKPFIHADSVLRAVAERGIPVAIVSNKNVGVIKNTMETHKLTGLVPDELIVGSPMYKTNQKPHPAAYTDVLLPLLKQRYGEDFEHQDGDVLMIGDTVSDLKFAHNIGAKSVWCAYGDGSKEECRSLKPEFMIDQLFDVLAVIDGLQMP